MLKKLFLYGCILFPIQVLATDAHIAHIKIVDLHVRATKGDLKTTAAYLSITNEADEDDTLLSVESSAADHVMIHNTVTDKGVSRMIGVDKLALPSHKTVEFKPGGMHIMLMGLKSPLKKEDMIPLTLKFKHAGELTLSADIY